MKITTLQVHNIGPVADSKIEFNKPLIILYGEIRSGKSTHLNSVRWVLGGAYPSDIIRHGEKEAFIELGFDGGVIRREWYVAKDKTTKAREVVFVRGGKPVPSPVAELKRFLNPFLIDQDYLRNMTELERKKYFAELFAVDTTALDTELFTKDREAVQLRAVIKGYGEINLTPVEAVDATALRAERQKILDEHANRVKGWRLERDEILAKHQGLVRISDKNNSDAANRVAAIVRYKGLVEDGDREINELEKRMVQLKSEKARYEAWLKDNPEIQKMPLPTAPDVSALEKKIDSQADTAALDAEISEAAANQVRYEQFLQNKKRAESKTADEKKLSSLDKRLREIRDEKIAKLKNIGAESGIKDLSFDEDGNFTYEGTQAGMLSTSQIMRLSSELSGKYPEGLGVEILDRGESLGRAIFDYVQHAEKKKVTVLATIVGQRPADVPEKVGVFVVKDGVILPDIKGTPDPKQGTLL